MLVYIAEELSNQKVILDREIRTHGFQLGLTEKLLYKEHLTYPYILEIFAAKTATRSVFCSY